MDAGYRLTVYADDDVTVLTPSAGAPHASPFQVTSRYDAGTPAFLPYLQPTISGSRSRYDHKTRNMTIGQITVTIEDQRVTGLDTERFVTAFVGNTGGQGQLIGKLAVLEETSDGGATWARFGTYRIQRPQLQGRSRLLLLLRELGDEYTAQCFVAAPHASITYAAAVRLWPVTPNNVTYGPWTSAVKRILVNAAPIQGGQGAALAPAVTDPTDIVTQALIDRVNQDQALKYAPPSAADLIANKRVRARVAWTTGALAGHTYDYWLAGMVANGNSTGGGKAFLQTAIIVPVGATDPNHGALPAANCQGNLELLLADGPSAACPLYLNDVPIKQLLQDLHDGKFYWLNDDGTVQRTFPYDAAALAALPNDLPVFRGVIKQAWDMDTFIASQLCLPFGIGRRRDAQGRAVFFDVRMPATIAGLPTLGDADATKDPPEWQQDLDEAVSWLQINTYQDAQVPDAQVTQTTDFYPKFAPTRIQDTTSEFIQAKFSPLDIGMKPMTIDAQGLRATGIDTDVIGGRQRAAWLSSIVQDLAMQFKRPFAGGPMRLKRRCERTATVNALLGGQFLLVQQSDVPDPLTNRRGGTRLMLVEDVSPAGLAVQLSLLDMGITTVAGVPTLANLIKMPGNTLHGVDVDLTINAHGDRVFLQCAVTAAGAAQPAADSPLWVMAGQFTASATLQLMTFPSGMKVWVRARSFPTEGNTLLLPSAWVVAGGVVLDAYPAPITGAYTNATASTADLTWVNTDSTRRIEVATNAGVRMANGLLPAGSTAFRATGLAASLTQNVRVRYIDDVGGIGADLVIAVTTSGVAPTAPTPRGLLVLPGAQV